MKLAEALILRADTKKRFDSIKQRLIGNAKIQEGDKPAEKPEVLIKELEATAGEFERLVKAINKTNSLTEFAKGKTLTDALAERDTLALRGNAMRALATEVTEKDVRWGRQEIKFVRTVDGAKIQKRADDLAKQYREHDTRIQEMNWKTDLVE
ncbi:MAG TPA: DIP1984 family protein [Pyrinomonadaceae bacterium]